MSKLENLVPPLELCKQIPEGIFSDSAFWRVWSAVEQRYILCQRGTGAFINAAAIPCPCGMRYIYPAPTLQEILEEFDHVACASRFKRQWLVSYEDDPVDEDASKWGNMIDIRDTDAPTAALKLFLEMEARR